MAVVAAARLEAVAVTVEAAFLRVEDIVAADIAAVAGDTHLTKPGIRHSETIACCYDSKKAGYSRTTPATRGDGFD